MAKQSIAILYKVSEGRWQAKNEAGEIITHRDGTPMFDTLSGNFAARLIYFGYLIKWE